MSSVLRVEPLTTARAVRGPFDYLLPEALRGTVSVGSLLVVPFGRRDVLGIVVGLAENSEVAQERLLAPRRAVAQDLPEDLVGLAAWLAQEYCSTPARALGLMLPPGASRGAGALTRLMVEATAVGQAALHPASSVRLTPHQRDVLELVAQGSRPATQTGADHGALRRLDARGLLRLEARELARRPRQVAVGARRPQPPRLTPEQASAMDEVAAALAARRSECLLLHGVTGSGKTEIYLRAGAAALEQGRGAIVLVPEIALTPQIVSRFSERFGDTVAVLHSRLSSGERHDEWRRLRRREARVCVGPRSAVFAPIEDLGLIVIDEEHDASYKHEGDPRYDARSVAAERARRSNALLLCGSATPRPETFHTTGRLVLSRRVDDAPLPPVEILDMRGCEGGLHSATAQALADVRRARGKAIVLLNRRGWSNFLTCRSCGRVWGCPDCDVALVLHRSERRVVCHHCGHREPVPQRCPDCGSLSVARHGTGTERLESELAASLDDGSFAVFRLDADVAGARDGPASVLHQFESAPAGVLLGTQMVAKGHDFPDVSLAVVLDADATLRFPDFRAEERTFALIAQLAGRAGRGGSARVLVQSMAPDVQAILYASRHDSQGFLDAELQRRAALRYPPFARLIRVVCAAAEAGAADRAATALRDRLVLPGDDVLGPASLFRLRGRERSQVVVKSQHGDAAVRAVGAAVQDLAGAREHRAVSFSVDVDPQ